MSHSKTSFSRPTLIKFIDASLRGMTEYAHYILNRTHTTEEKKAEYEALAKIAFHTKHLFKGAHPYTEYLEFNTGKVSEGIFNAINAIAKDEGYFRFILASIHDALELPEAVIDEPPIFEIIHAYENFSTVKDPKTLWNGFVIAVINKLE